MRKYSPSLRALFVSQEGYINECISTLQFANRCRIVQNQPRVTYLGQSEEDKDFRIKKLMEEVGGLKRKLASMGVGDDEMLMAGEGMGEMSGKSRALMMAQVAEKVNDKLMEVLTELGFQPHLTEDGRVQRADGRTFGVEAPNTADI